MIFDSEKPFWRPEKPLTEAEKQLLQAVFAAHDASTQRRNVSSDAVAFASIGSGDYTKAISAALACIGGLHAPVIQAMALLDSPMSYLIARQIVADGKKVPGFGNSFYRGIPDELWIGVSEALRLNAPDLHDKIERITTELHSLGKKIYPNPGCFTAATAIVLGIPAPVAPWIFVAGRLTGWTKIAGAHL